MAVGKYKIFSFFSGSGFLDLGFENNGFDIEFVNEFSTSFMNAYKYARANMKMREPKYGYGNNDINIYLNEKKEELISYLEDARKDGSLIGFIGGPPCPDFSVAGKNRGKNGDNGKLSLSYVKLIIEMKPDFFLFENVKGLWRTARHREFFEELKAMLCEAGYSMVNRLTNSLEFAVPQDRDRILLFGVKKELCQVTDESFNWEKYMSYSMEQIKNYPWIVESPFDCKEQISCPPNIPEELTVEYWFRKNDVENHLNANRYFNPKQGLVRMQTVAEGDVSKKSYKRLHRWRYSPTAAYGNNEVHLHPYRARRISVAEALAIQSLPKEFCLPNDMTLTDMFKTVGNGVPYLMSSGIASTIYDFLEENTHAKDNGV